ncbi:Dolichyl-phosphate-mannose-protein mannosyltransferase [Tessaracoccus bendigoensis DSM 12906]|uniref:Dolichyl-phosphate-mannose-protein mannosyltransferase n=1 Tax=Tessaracoccus bendigoensis DSM 12906 TaxID=1123357 RepID=A0A1M6K7Q9_9ACTN|nr:glycosyltransferase family 39 protein [Tessaracoccus bendigoensis]SHJ54850.1 Dolichyl-phosphate-mannose-protein mannosyltransferase [Tessaracoccus bendigoensis DSM 12906]
MTILSQGPTLIRSKGDPVSVLYPILAALFVLAASIGLGVNPVMTLLLATLTALGVRSNVQIVNGTKYLQPYLMFLGLKLVILVYQIHFRNLPLSGVDWQFYDRFGTQLALDSGGDLFIILTNAEWDLFTRLTASVYALFGGGSEQMYFLVFVTSLATFTYIYRAGRILTGELGGVRAAMLFMVWPHEIVMSVTFLREMPIQLLVAASLYQFLRFWNTRRIAPLLLALALSLAATLMHSGMIVLPIAFAYLAIRNHRVGGIQLVRTALFIAAMLVLLRTPLAEPLLSKFDSLTDVGDLLQPGQGPDVATMEATTFYLDPAASDVPLYQLPSRMVLFALSPLPWQATSLGTAISVLIEGLPRLGLVAMLLLSYPRCRSGKPQSDVLIAGLLLSILAGYIIFSLGVSTYGSAIRHRAKFFPIEIVLAYAAFAAGPVRRAGAPLFSRRSSNVQAARR